MKNCTPEENLLQFCPICQVPFLCLKITAAAHVNVCKVASDHLPDCENGIECCSSDIFHYRDFSHKILAFHRENLGKRKIEEFDINLKTRQTNKALKKSLQSSCIPNLIEKDCDDGDCNIFVTSSIQTNKRKPSQIFVAKPTLKVARKDSRKIIKMECQTVSPIQSEKFVVNKMVKLEGETTIDLKEEGETFKKSDQKDLEENIKKSPDRKNAKNHETNSEKCKIEWNNLFKNKSTELTNKGTPTKKKRNLISKPVKTCPSFKKIPGTSFAVDAFQFGNIPGITTYFLTHFHADHYMGLRKAFSYPIYCSLITANLVRKKLRVNEQYIHVLPLNEPVVISKTEITFFDANHCPGAVMILFRLTSGEQFLHVGDFRACPEMEEIPQLCDTHIDRLYLDTTYFNPNYVFPTQREVIDRVKAIISARSEKHERILFISGTYSIGKEKVFLAILDVLKCKLWAQPQKVDIFKCVNDEVILSALTNDPKAAKIHVLPMNYLRFDRLKKYLLDLNGTFTHIIAFKPTGWEMGRKVGADWLNESREGTITIYGIPYSEHSNYEELCRFIKFIKASKVIPTVPMKSRDMYGILKSVTDSYKTGPKQQMIQSFMLGT